MLLRDMDINCFLHVACHIRMNRHCIYDYFLSAGKKEYEKDIIVLLIIRAQRHFEKNINLYVSNYPCPQYVYIYDDQMKRQEDNKMSKIKL